MEEEGGGGGRGGGGQREEPGRRTEEEKGEEEEEHEFRRRAAIYQTDVRKNTRANPCYGPILRRDMRTTSIIITRDVFFSPNYTIPRYLVFEQRLQRGQCAVGHGLTSVRLPVRRFVHTSIPLTPPRTSEGLKIPQRASDSFGTGEKDLEGPQKPSEG